MSTPLIAPHLATAELRPILLRTAPSLRVQDHAEHPHQLESLVGPRGLLLAFIGDVWQAVNIRRIIWLQKHAPGLQKLGVNIALVARDRSTVLYGFYISSTQPPQFPLLADTDGRIHQTFYISDRPGMILLDAHLELRRRWLMDEDSIWPRIADLQSSLEGLPH